MATSGETKLRGTALDGSEQPRAVDHTGYKKAHNPDTVLRVDNEKDNLYTDGLEVDDDTPTAAAKITPAEADSHAVSRPR